MIGLMGINKASADDGLREMRELHYSNKINNKRLCERRLVGAWLRRGGPPSIQRWLTKPHCLEP